MTEPARDELIRAALDAQKRAYAPIRTFRSAPRSAPPAARIFQGVNVENASFGLTICAERVAAAAAVAAGEREFVTASPSSAAAARRLAALAGSSWPSSIRPCGS